MSWTSTDTGRVRPFHRLDWPPTAASETHASAAVWSGNHFRRAILSDLVHSSFARRWIFVAAAASALSRKASASAMVSASRSVRIAQSRIVGGVEQQHQLPRSRAFRLWIRRNLPTNAPRPGLRRPGPEGSSSASPTSNPAHVHAYRFRWSMLDRCRSAHHEPKDRPPRSFGPTKLAHLCPNAAYLRERPRDAEAHAASEQPGGCRVLGVSCRRSWPGKR